MSSINPVPPGFAPLEPDLYPGGDISLPPPSGSLFSPDNKPGPYQQCDISADYIWDTGLGQMAAAGDDSQGKVACRVVKLSAAYGRKVVRFTITRLKKQPLAPSPELNDPNAVLKKARVRVMAPVLQADGKTYLYGIRGAYTYILLVPITHLDGFPGVSGPYTTTPASLNAVGPQQFSQQIVS